MSIRLHNGYLLDSSLDAFSLGRKLAELFRPVFESELLAATASLAVSLERFSDAQSKREALEFILPGIDISRVRFSDDASGDIDAALHALELTQVSLRQPYARRMPGYDLTLSITFIGHEGSEYALLYTESEEYRKAWNAIDGVHHYPYWNSVDGPDDISPEEWLARGELWEAVIGKSGIPSTFGLQWNLHTNDIRYAQMGEEELSSAMSRARIHAKEQRERTEAWLADNPDFLSQYQDS